MSVRTYQCPCCGAPLQYAGDVGKLHCASCGNSFDPADVQALQGVGGESDIGFDRPEEGFTREELESIRAYVCQNCGARLMTEATTTATCCAYCGSPAVLADAIEAGVRPQRVVPFRVSAEEAEAAFHGYFTGKRLLPNVFLKTRNRIAEMRRLYVPYWLFDCAASARITFDARRSRSIRQGDWMIVRTDHFLVQRAGSMRFAGIPVDGSEKLDNRITESLEPYDLTAAVPFQPAVLAGAMADRADVDAAACEARAAERVAASMESALRSTVVGYTSVTARQRSVHSDQGHVTPALMPVWLITTEKEEKGGTRTYTFAINGQTGRLTCDVSYDRGKAAAWYAGIFAPSFALGLGILAFLNGRGALPQGEGNATGLLIVAGIALVLALAVVGSMKAKLKTAKFQSDAAGYGLNETFQLSLREDRFLYTTETRHRIAQQNNNTRAPMQKGR